MPSNKKTAKTPSKGKPPRTIQQLDNSQTSMGGGRPSVRRRSSTVCFVPSQDYASDSNSSFDVLPDFEEDEGRALRQIELSERIRNSISASPTAVLDRSIRLRHSRTKERPRKLGQKPKYDDESCAGIFRT